MITLKTDDLAYLNLTVEKELTRVGKLNLDRQRLMETRRNSIGAETKRQAKECDSLQRWFHSKMLLLSNCKGATVDSVRLSVAEELGNIAGGVRPIIFAKTEADPWMEIKDRFKDLCISYLNVDTALVTIICDRYSKKGVKPALEPVLTNDQIKQFSSLIGEQAEMLQRKVLPEVVEMVKDYAQINALSIIQEVVASVLAHHSHELTDENTAIYVMLRIARKHCNRRKKRVSRDRTQPLQPQGRMAINPINTSQLSPSCEAYLRELWKLRLGFSLDGNSDQVLQFIEALEDPLEKKVFVLLANGRTFDEISRQLKLDQRVLRHAWDTVIRQANEYVIASEEDEDDLDEDEEENHS